MLLVWSEATQIGAQFWSNSYSKDFGAWSGPTEVAPELDYVPGESRFAVSQDGGALLFWVTEPNAAEPAAGCASYLPQSRWSDACEAPASSVGPMEFLRLAASSATSIQAAWMEGDLIRSAAFDLSDRTWHDPQTIAVSADNDSDPQYFQIHQDNLGRAMVFWAHFIDTTGYVWYSRLE
jgi:hypothetical protein